MPTPLSTVALAFLDAIAIGENYDPIDYTELVGGGNFSDFKTFPTWPGKTFSSGISHAAGRYQFEPATWKFQANKLGLRDFSPASQDQAAWDLAVTVYRNKTRRNLESDLSARIFDKIAPALQSTWTSISAITSERYLGALTARRMLSANPKS